MGDAMNRQSSRIERKLPRALRTQRPWWAAPAAFVATLLALPVNAITIPDEPLSTGIRVAPNILFILDDSGSMAWENINNTSISSITGTSFSDSAGKNGIDEGYSNDLSSQSGNSWMYEQNYVTNTLFYNPGTTYQPWMTASGSRMTGGTSFTSAYSSANYVSYTDSLISKSTTSSTTNLSASTRTFYAPKTASSDSTYLSNIGNYYRFQILATDGKIYRAVWTNELPAFSTVGGTFNGSALKAQVRSATECTRYDRWGNCTRTGTVYHGAWANTDGTLGTSEASTAPDGSYFTITVPAGQTNLTVTTSGSDADADLYVRRGSAPDTGAYDCVSNGGTSNESCSIANPAAGTWYIAVRAADANNAGFANVTINATYYLNPDAAMGCAVSTSGYDWRKCERVTPGGQVADAEAEAAEKVNFATWYSYYRTRIKAAKGGAAEAFSTQGRKVRVGYRSLHENGSDDFDIPVSDGNDGRFVNGNASDGDAAVTTSRSTWFYRLFAASASNGTPLQSILDDAGQYFQKTTSSGPYGPESGSAQFSCRQNFTVLTTDGYWNGGTVSTDTGGDGSNGSVITNGPAAADGGVATSDPTYKSYQYKQPAPYKDANTNTLADVAMKYWKTDLRTDLANNVPSNYSSVASENDQIGRDPAFWQHMVTFTISIGLKTKSGLSSVSEVTTSTTWAAPGNDDADNIDDLLHAAVNGRGMFVSAASPQDFADGLAAALAAIAQRTGSFSNATASDATSLNTGTKIFKASYVSGLWTGALKSEYATSGVTEWSATIPAFATRQNKVFTFDGTSGATFPTANQVSALDKTGLGAASYEVSGTDNADYIKGKQTLEGSGIGQLRVRSTLLGDIVNSSPAYVDETGTIYVGANDGMMHAFDASTGVELFAYVPNIVNFASLKNLSAGDYTHQWFVDGPIVVSRRSLGPGSTNILVGSLGRGGKGLYALDVTSPSTFAASNVKWERSETPGSNMGQVLGAPVLASVRNGSSGTPAVIFGNGVNSSSGKAVLEVLSLSDGSVIREIATDDTTGNGLFAPTGLYAADGKTLVYVYAGDLQGNIWKFDLTSSNPASWSASKVFHAEKTTGTPQPITSGLVTAVDPRTNTRWVFFGTGSYLTAADGNDNSTEAQSMYGVMDNGTTYTRANLTQRTVTTDGTSGKRYFQELASLPGTSKGWYVDLPGQGERIVQNAQIDGSFLVTASMMPSGNSCDDAAGSGYINALTAFAGIASGKSYFDLDGDGNTDDTGTAGHPTGSVKTSGMPTLPVLLPGQIVINTSDGSTQKFNKGQALWNRVSWREIRND